MPRNLSDEIPEREGVRGRWTGHGSPRQDTADEEKVRDVDEVIWRVEQSQQHGMPMTDDELIEAAEVLGTRLDRADARRAAETVARRLSEPAGGDPVVAQGALHMPTVPGIVATSTQRKAFHAPVALRLLGAAVWAGLAVTLFFLMAPQDVADTRADVSLALGAYEMNEDRAQGAPQQQVVNGWVAKDLLAILAEQQSDAARAERQAADRLAAEVALGVIALAVGLALPARARQG
jgi:hypothetical protein